MVGIKDGGLEGDKDNVGGADGVAEGTTETTAAAAAVDTEGGSKCSIIFVLNFSTFCIIYIIYKENFLLVN
jgi:hypothetical protein